MIDIIDQIENRMRDPAVVKFKSDRAAEFIRQGFHILTALDMAESETRGRARVSLEVGITEALSANIVAIRDSTGQPRFCLTNAEIKDAA